MGKPTGNTVTPDSYVEVTGAYGRTYRTLTDMRVDWHAGRDFAMTVGGYINSADAERYNVGVNGRYGRYADEVGTLR